MGNTYNSIIDCINSSKNHNGKKEIENILNEDNNNFENKEKKKIVQIIIYLIMKYL